MSFKLKITRFFGFAPEEEELERIEEIRNSWKSLRVTPRGGIRIDPREVRQDPGFQEFVEKAKSLIDKKYQ